MVLGGLVDVNGITFVPALICMIIPLSMQDMLARRGAAGALSATHRAGAEAAAELIARSASAHTRRVYASALVQFAAWLDGPAAVNAIAPRPQGLRAGLAQVRAEIASGCCSSPGSMTGIEDRNETGFLPFVERRYPTPDPTAGDGGARLPVQSRGVDVRVVGCPPACRLSRRGGNAAWPEPPRVPMCSGRSGDTGDLEAAELFRQLIASGGGLRSPRRLFPSALRPRPRNNAKVVG